MKKFNQLVKEKSIDELAELSRKTKEMIKKDHPRHIGVSTLCNALGIQEFDHINDEFDYINGNYGHINDGCSENYIS